MKFEVATKEEFDKASKRNTELKSFLEEFLEANIEYARVKWAGDYKDEKACCHSLKQVAVRNNMPILVKVREHSVYLINTRYSG